MILSISFLIVYYTFYSVFAGTVITEFNLFGRSIASDCGNAGVVFEHYSSASRAHCASECSRTPNCDGFIYNKDGKDCFGCDDVSAIDTSTNYSTNMLVYHKKSESTLPEELLIPPTTQPSITSTSASGPVSTATTSTSSTSTAASPSFPDFLRIGTPCETDQDCPKVYNLCLDGFCNCVAGYVYNPGSDTCAESCVTYGMTYIAHTARDYTANISFVSHEMTAKDCSTTCSADNTCRGFSHSPTYDVGGWCSTQTSTPLSNPTNFLLSGYNFTYYTRNCA